MPIGLRYAARSDVGLVRSDNQDSGYAGPHLLVVADGMGGHAGGDIASSTVITELVELDHDSLAAAEAGKHHLHDDDVLSVGGSETSSSLGSSTDSDLLLGSAKTSASSAASDHSGSDDYAFPRRRGVRAREDVPDIWA